MLFIAFLSLLVTLLGVITSATSSSTTVVTIPWASIASDSTGTLLAGAASDTRYFPLYISNDSGLTWKPTKSPSFLWRNVFSDASGQILVGGAICGSGGYPCYPLYISTDRGETWKTSYGLPNGAYYFGIAADRTVTNLWTTGTSCGLYRSLDGGLSWSKVLIPRKLFTTNTCYGVASSDDGKHIYAVNMDGYISVSSDGGSTWTLTNQHDSEGFRAFATDGSGQYVFVISLYRFYASFDYGATWTIIKSTYYDIGTPQFKAVTTTKNGDVAYVIVGGVIYHYIRDTGIYSAYQNTTSSFTSVVTNHDGDQFYASAVNSKNSTIYATKDDGKSWSLYDTNLYY